MTGTIIALSISSTHSFSKINQNSIEFIAGIGIKGDAHAGEKVKHRSRVAKDPTQPNLRQVHLIHSELHQELIKKGFDISPGNMGENITTQGIDLLNLPTNTLLHLGDEAKIKITGLRNPCAQLNTFQPGLMSAVLDKDKDGNLVRKSGVMGIVITSGIVRTGDRITIELPTKPYRKLEKV